VFNTASCCCGECTIILYGEPKSHGICHCDNCKKRTGSAFGVLVYFTYDQVIRQVGSMGIYNQISEVLENNQSRFFCQTCGTTLYWVLSNQPEIIGVAGGCFVNSLLPEPSFSRVNQNQCLWLTLPDQWSL